MIRGYLIKLTLLVTLISNASAQETQGLESLSTEEYVIVNVFLQGFESIVYLKSIIEPIPDSKSFNIGYGKKVKLYTSFKNLCNDHLKNKKVLDYETNLACSMAETLSVYEHLFTKKELSHFQEQLQNQKQPKNIDPNRIEQINVKLVTEKSILPKKGKLISIHGIYPNKKNNKVLIKYSYNDKILYQVLRRENGWWKNIINFEN
ncbi:MAG: hypothetical protein ACX93O_15570 [Flagellimonas sp.]